MKRQMMMMTLMTLLVLNSRITGWAADDAKAAAEAEIKAVSGKLMSGDAQKIQEASAAIRQMLEANPRIAIPALVKNWNTPLFFAKRYDDIASFAQNAAIQVQIANPPITMPGEPPVEMMMQMRVRALLAADRGAEALVAAKSLYNVVTMARTSVAIDLVGQALTAAHKDQPGLAKKFRLQQMESASTNATADAAGKTPSMLTEVKVDPKPYEVAIIDQMNADSLTLANLKTVGNLYLLSDQPKKAEEVFRRIYEMADQANLSAAIEGIARSYRAQDGNIARANAYIVAERNKTQ